MVADDGGGGLLRSGSCRGVVDIFDLMLFLLLFLLFLSLTGELTGLPSESGGEYGDSAFSLTGVKSDGHADLSDFCICNSCNSMVCSLRCCCCCCWCTTISCNFFSNGIACWMMSWFSWLVVWLDACCRFDN